MDKQRPIVNIITIPVTIWAIIQFYFGAVKVVSSLEFHRSFFLLIILIGISLLITVNLKWITQWWKEDREKKGPEGQLKSLANDVNRLSEMDLWLALDLTLYEPDDAGASDDSYIDFLEKDTEHFELAIYVINRLNSICNIDLPELIIYPKFFRAIRIFVERGDIDEIKRISSDMSKYVYF